MIKATLIAFGMVLSATISFSQSNDEIVARQGSVSLMPLFQGWTLNGGVSFSETSVALSAYAPINRFLGVSLRGSYASVSGGVPSLRDLNDTQLWINYLLESANLVFRCAVNLPSGRRELNPEEFFTSLLISEQAFDLSVPNFGQGLNFSPGALWAVKVSENVVLGFGGTYQFKGAYKPLAGLGEYDPGDEIMLTGGVDLRLNEVSTISADAVFTNYQADRFGGGEVFAAGNKWVGNLRFRTALGRNELSVLACYRTRGKNDVAVAGVLVSEQEKITPDQLAFVIQYMTRFNEKIKLLFIAEANHFQSTPAPRSGIDLFALGVSPEFEASETISIPVQIKFMGGTQKDGSFLGSFAGGIGVSARF